MSSERARGSRLTTNDANRANGIREEFLDRINRIYRMGGDGGG